MAAPTPAYIQSAELGKESGKIVRGNRRTVNLNAVDCIVTTLPDSTDLTGVYSFNSGTASTISSAGHNGSATGFLWFNNPNGGTKTARLRRFSVEMTIQTTSAISTVSTPLIQLSRGTFTGTFGEPILTAAKRKTTDSSAACAIRSNSSGATVTVGAAIEASVAFGVEPTTADAFSNKVVVTWAPGKADDYVTVAPDECLIVWQSGAGTGAESRVVSFSGTWDEYVT